MKQFYNTVYGPAHTLGDAASKQKPTKPKKECPACGGDATGRRKWCRPCATDPYNYANAVRRAAKLTPAS